MNEIVVDNFAGGGGASTGIEMAIGRSVDIAINHDPDAIEMHRANHPTTRHYCESVWDVNPVEACAGRPVGLAWFSPDCKHFSKAKGGTPVSKRVRGLAWIVLRWAALVRPRVIMLENVEEFKTWGPIRGGRPIKAKAGQTFDKWWRQLSALGYQIEMRELRACDYGTPTIRKRLFIIARCDGAPIVWPEPTHGAPQSPEVLRGERLPWRTAAEVVDWSIPCPSIFERKRPLTEKTMRRIARGIQRFIVDSADPFIVHYKYGNEPKSVMEPLSTVTAVNSHYIVSPTLIAYHDERGGEARGQSVHDPIGTLDTSNRFALVSAFISKYFDGGYTGAGSAATEPVHTITARDHNALCAAHIVQLNNHCDGQPMDKPLNTIVAGPGHFGEVRAFLVKYYGANDAQPLTEPLGTVTTRDRFGLITIRGATYAIVDIGMRMLEPRELFDAQGFPEAYIIDRDTDGRPTTKKNQVARCGNAVCPPIAAALVSANLPELRTIEKGA